METNPTTIYTGPGLTINYSSISITPLSANGVTAANLSVIDLSPGVNASLSPSSVSLTQGAQSVTLTITVASSIKPGTYDFTIDAVAGATNATSMFAFTVVPHIVFIYDQAYWPANDTVSTGSSILWMNLEGPLQMDPGIHNVVFQGNLNAASPNLMRYNVWTYTFTQAGVFNYICTIHPFMHGQVTVTQ